MSKSDEALDALRLALRRLRAEADRDDGKSNRAKAAGQLALEVDDILRRWSSELAVSEVPSE